MQFLASLHIVLTCSFVFLLAYLLSRVFTYLAHSVLHGSHTSRRSSEGSSRGRRGVSFKTQLLELHEDDAGAAFMTRLQEEDEEEGENDDADDDKDAYQDAVVHASVRTAKFDMGGGIFDDGSDQEYDAKFDVGGGAHMDNGGGMKGEGLDATDNGGYEAREVVYRDFEIRELEDAGENGLKEEKGAPNKSVLGDAQGNSSMQQRLPPTWSDLERMVNMNSMKHSPPPSVSPLPEY